MVQVAMTGDLVRTRYVILSGLPIGLQVGVNQPCCNECPPCCACDGINIPEACGTLQSMVVEVSLNEFGNCLTGANVFTFSVTADDQDNGFPFSKNASVAVANGNMIFNLAFFCEGGASCFVLQGSIVSDCGECSSGGSPFFNIRLNGTDNENGDCCPAGREIEFTPCDGVSGSISVTLVY